MSYDIRIPINSSAAYTRMCRALEGTDVIRTRAIKQRHDTRARLGIKHRLPMDSWVKVGKYIAIFRVYDNGDVQYDHVTFAGTGKPKHKLKDVIALLKKKVRIYEDDASFDYMRLTL